MKITSNKKQFWLKHGFRKVIFIFSVSVRTNLHFNVKIKSMRIYIYIYLCLHIYPLFLIIVESLSRICARSRCTYTSNVTILFTSSLVMINYVPTYRLSCPAPRGHTTYKRIMTLCDNFRFSS